MPGEPTLDADAKAKRCFALVWQRMVELADIGSPPNRRPRTLTIRGAAQECAALAQSSLRSGGVTNAGAEPELAGHGIAMLPDIAGEALDLLATDCVLKTMQPELVELLRKGLEKLVGGQFTQGDVATLEAYCQLLERTYAQDAFQAILTIVAGRPKALFDLESVCVSLISELRSKGWSDASVSHCIGAAREHHPDDDHLALAAFRTSVSGAARRFSCFVAVTITSGREEIHLPGEFEIVDDAPITPPSSGAPRRGPFALVRIDALDGRYAAEAAFTKVSSVLGAAAVFVRTDILVRSSIVVLDDGSSPSAMEVRLRLAREPRVAAPGQLRRVVQSALASTSGGSIDAVFDAIRHRQRAMDSDDLESRFMLLWLGIERLCLGTGGSGRILQAIRALVPKAVTLGKLRRDIAALGAAIAQTRLADSHRQDLAELIGLGRSHGAADHEALLTVMMRGGNDSDSRRITAGFFESDVRLVQWYAGLQKDVEGPSPDRLWKYLDRSRERIERQCLRLYRARNSVAHAARGPAWLADLVSHAHFYLTQLIAICVHYRERTPNRPAAEILLRRAGQYDAFASLLQAKHARALSPRGLLRPTSIVGDHDGPAGDADP